ncbi:asparagine synthase (glutamine-hydrolyzing) [Arhodomonas sp. SL1]|uniref:asparagine synthase (glutamine-hydrolyzing) n=1 Tax=Arhodomonas sp. SL1 TaxID=3425691 RepID=UPI003F884954
MCGIAGVSLDAPVPEERIAAAVARLRHRGPDDRGVWRGGNVALGHTRLSIIDLAGGHQPLTTADGALVLVANGEIYNHVELRAELERAGCVFRTHSDCEVLLHAYRVHGDDFLDHVRGMFAFALYDVPRRRLLLARDHLGQKPLFVAAGADGVRFASEIKALLPLLPTRPSVRPVGLARYLQHQFAAGRETILEGVERVLPGEILEVVDGRVRGRRWYWDATRVEPREIGFDGASREFDELFDQVMREHQRSDVPFGLFLSGGVDSATLLGALSRLRDEPLHTYSVGFEAPEMVDELPLAAQVAGHNASHHHPFAPDGATLLARLPRTIWAADELMRDFANLPTLYLAEQARRDLKVVFSGEGGDEAFGGYGRYRVRALERRLKALAAPGSGGFRTGGLLRGSTRRRLTGDALAAAMRHSRDPFTEAWASTPRSWSDLQRMQYVDLTTALPDNLLVKADRMLMANGVEGRLPFVDHRIVAFGLSLPDRLKVVDGEGKHFLKRWAERLVPRELLYAPKRGFHVPVRGWFGEHLSWLQRVLPAHPAVREWFDPRGVAWLLRRDAARGRLSAQAFAIVQFALWHRIVLAGDGADPGSDADPFRLLEDCA